MDDFLTEKQIERINRIRAERAAKKVMGSAEPTTRFGEPIKRSAAEAVLTNPDLLKQIGSFTNPKYIKPLELELDKYNDALENYKDRLERIENPPKRRQTARAKREAEEEKETLLYARGRLRILFDELILQPLQRHLEKVWASKYGGMPGTNADKSNLSPRAISKVFEYNTSRILKENDIESPP
jgi:hypothetical protein